MFRTFLLASSLLFVLHAGLNAQEPQAKSEDAKASDSPASKASNGDSDSLTFNFRETPWPEVFKWFAEKADLTLDLTDTPEGTFNYIDDRKRTLAEALDALNGYLLPRGYVTIRRDKFLVVLKTDNPNLSNLIPTVPASRLDDYGDYELLRIVVPLEGLQPDEVAEQLDSILGPHGMAAPLNASKSLILQGSGKSLRQTAELLAGAVIPPADDEIVFRSFPLEHIPAADAERHIQSLFGLGSNPFRASMRRRQEYSRRRYGRGRGDDDDDRAPTPRALVDEIATNMKVSGLRHTNSLLVTATPAAVALIENILESIDVPPPEGARNVYANNTPVLRVYIVEDADEDDVAETVDAVMPGVVINEDGRHNSIHVLATPAEHEEVDELIRTIDGGGMGGGGVEVIPLTRNDPVVMAELLTSLFANEDRDDRPVITAEPRNASLIIRATGGQMAEITKMLAAYGETLRGAAPTTVGNRFRKLRLQSPDDAERIARVVQDLLQSDGRFDNPIRVVVPSSEPTSRLRTDSGDVRRMEIDGAPDQTTPNVREETKAPADDDDAVSASAVLDRYAVARFVSEASSTETKGKKPSEASSAPRITIEVRNGELFMYSNDNDALDRVEQTIRELARQMPSRTEWTVFYLRAASAEDIAQSLVQLLSADPNANAAVGVGYADESMSTFGVQTTRIVPDARTNALFVSGPEAQVEQAARFLKFLDNTDLPESLRDRVPRAIPVRYADVTAVADMVRELYQDFMEDPNERRRERRRDDRDDDDRDAAVRAAASQTPGLQPPGIRLTVAVDLQARELLVSCNEQLFEQIRELVVERDQAALAALPPEPSVQLIQVKSVDGAQVQSLLGGLTPQITVIPQLQPDGSPSPAGARPNEAAERFRQQSNRPPERFFGRDRGDRGRGRDRDRDRDGGRDRDRDRDRGRDRD